MLTYLRELTAESALSNMLCCYDKHIKRELSDWNITAGMIRESQPRRWGKLCCGDFFLPLMRLLSTFSMSGCTSLRTSMWVMWCAFLPNIQIGSAWKRAWFVAVVNHTRVLLACQEELLEATVSHSIFKWTGRGWGWIFFSEYLTTYYTVLLWAVGDLSCNDEPGKRASNDKCSPHTLSS